MPDSSSTFRLHLSILPIQVMALLLKLIYRYRVEGAENIPHAGPYIAVMNEFSFLCTMLEAVSNVTLLREPTLQRKTLYFVGEELWAIRWMRYNFSKVFPASFPLLAHGGGLLGAGLLDGLRALEKDWVVVINPDGDMPRDGRPLPLRGGTAWLALHSAAPLVPIVAGAGAYDAWPPWLMRPSLRGKIVHKVGKPFKVTEIPLQEVRDEDIDRANARIRAEIEQLWFGPGGIDEWAGPPRKQGVPVEGAIDLGPVPDIPKKPEGEEGQRPVSVWKRGLSLLLWRCPICRSNDSLVHRRPLFRPQHLRCQACGTGWAVRREMGKDFRLEVVDGSPDLIGLDMALSTWYDEMKRGFEPEPIASEGAELQPGEEVYLRARDVRLIPYRSNSLFDVWNGREPPSREILTPSRAGEYGILDVGELTLTNLRLVWAGPAGGLDFWWTSVTDIGLRLYFLFRINYGVTSYRFTLGQENGLKWLTYAATVAKGVAMGAGRTVTTSPF